MRFRDLAWGAFGFAAITRSDYLAPYQELVTDTQFLRRLQTDPSLNDFQKLRGFLTHYGVPWAPSDLANQYLTVWPRLKPHVQRLASKSLEVCNLNNEGTVIKEAYAYLQWPYCWGGDTVASKSLHFFNIHLFVMWIVTCKLAMESLSGPKGIWNFSKKCKATLMRSLLTSNGCLYLAHPTSSYQHNWVIREFGH